MCKSCDCDWYSNYYKAIKQIYTKYFYLNLKSHIKNKLTIKYCTLTRFIVYDSFLMKRSIVYFKLKLAKNKFVSFDQNKTQEYLVYSDNRKLLTGHLDHTYNWYLTVILT